MNEGMNKRNIILVAVFLALLVLVLSFLIFYPNKETRKYKIKIITSPPGGYYQIGDTKGTTPSEISLKEGKYKVELSLLAYDKIQTEINVSKSSNKTLSYTFSSSLKGDKGISKETGDKILQKSRENYPYFDLLPFQGNTFYIDIPYSDGGIPVYLFKSKEEQGKNDALQWFKDHGVASPQSLNIIWKYDES